MPRFFFDFRQAGEFTADAAGTELADVEQAYLEAFKASQEMWSELLKKRRDPRRCFFEVRGETGDILFIFPLQEVVDACLDREQPAIQHTFQKMTSTHNYARKVRDEFAREMQRTHDVLQQSRDLLKKQFEYL